MSMRRAAIQCLAIFLLTATVCRGQDPAPKREDALAKFQRGDRVEIFLDNGSIFRGEIRVLFRDKVKLDLSFDHPVLDGTMDFKRSQILRAKRLQTLTERQKEQILHAKEARRADYQAELERLRGGGTTDANAEGGDAGEPGAAVPEEEGGMTAEQSALIAEFPIEQWDAVRYAEIVGTREADRTEEEARFLEVYKDWLDAADAYAVVERGKLLDRFPPEDGWSEEKYKEYKDQLVTLGIPMTPTQKDFVDNFDDWKQAFEEKAAADKKKEDEAKKAEEEKAAEEEGGEEEEGPATPPSGGPPAGSPGGPPKGVPPGYPGGGGR